MKTLALEFGTNLFGNLSQEIKDKLQTVIDNPCQKTWEESYAIILTFKPMVTLWQAVSKVDWMMPNNKSLGSDWEHIPNSETIIKAINDTILKPNKKELN